MPYIPHPARQGESASVLDWLRYHVGMRTWPRALFRRAPAGRSSGFGILAGTT
jgi:hypothetical protein